MYQESEEAERKVDGVGNSPDPEAGLGEGGLGEGGPVSQVFADGHMPGQLG